LDSEPGLASRRSRARYGREAMALALVGPARDIANWSGRPEESPD